MKKEVSLRAIVSRSRRFHKDEVGETSVLSNIMLLAVAALIVVLLIAFGKTAMQWLRDQWNRITQG
jgi:Flp pilus assembly pilin Flp